MLICTHHRFWQVSHGADQRIACLIRALRETAEIHLFFVGQLSEWDRVLIDRRFPHCAVFAGRGCGGAAELPYWDPQWAEVDLTSLRCERSCRTLSKLLGRNSYDAVVIEQIHLAYLCDVLDEAGTGALRILDTLDVMSERTMLFRQHGIPCDVAVSPAEEGAILARFDVVVAITARDAAAFRTLCADVEVIVAPHAPDEPPQPGLPTEGPPLRIGYLFGYHAANLAAIRSFVHTVWPRVRARFGSGIELEIAGMGSLALRDLAGAPGVDVTGPVDDLATFYHRQHVIINPAWVGTGFKLKNAEAIAWGKPLVTTPAGAQGLEEGAGCAFLVAHSDDDLVEILSAVAVSPLLRKELSREATRWYRTSLSPASAYEAVHRLLMSRCAAHA